MVGVEVSVISVDVDGLATGELAAVVAGFCPPQAESRRMLSVLVTVRKDERVIFMNNTIT